MKLLEAMGLPDWLLSDVDVADLESMSGKSRDDFEFTGDRVPLQTGATKKDIAWAVDRQNGEAWYFDPDTGKWTRTREGAADFKEKTQTELHDSFAKKIVDLWLAGPNRHALDTLIRRALDSNPKLDEDRLRRLVQAELSK